MTVQSISERSQFYRRIVRQYCTHILPLLPKPARWSSPLLSLFQVTTSNIHAVSLNDTQHECLFLLVPLCRLSQKSLKEHIQATSISKLNISADLVAFCLFLDDLDLRSVTLFRLLEHCLTKHSVKRQGQCLE
jgi:hypothetical protein